MARVRDSEQYETRVLLDIEGNALSITDHRGVVVQESAYVTLDGEDEALVERTVYGEALGTGAAASNLLGQPYQRYDGAGVVTSVAFDFKGNPLQSERRVALAYAATVDWIALDALTDPAAIAAAASSALEAETFTTTTEYDALNRPTSITMPDASEIRPGYNEAGLLETVDVRVRDAASWTAFVADIDYDAKGQREQIVYGASATTTEYAYDPLTFRMTQLKTTRASDDAVLQNLQYTYDPVGNITEIKDSAQQTVFFDDEVVLPVMAYTYDALYRLTQATGRELRQRLVSVETAKERVTYVHRARGDCGVG